MKIPVTIFSGYLGSGKTTIILNALKQYQEPVRFAMIKNEFGDVNVDAALARENNLMVKEIVNGCLCCVLVGALNPGIDQLLDERKPERIIIEASGDALPFPIVLELKKNPRVYLDGVISVVDCVNFEKIKDRSFVAREQAKHTDLIVFNKAGWVNEQKLYQVKEEVNDINPDTVKVETTDGVVDPKILFGLQDLTDKWEMLETKEQVEHLHDHHHEVESFVFKTNEILNKEKIEQVLKGCHNSRFYRIKGLVQTSSDAWEVVNSVFGRTTWQKYSDQAEETRIAFIGKDILKYKDLVVDYLKKAKD